ncbi:MAG TPA: hypothetical protein VN578_01140 [Candidatus Binatia bacterium]|nr:hypothetical protein [Candidatus Binatia bacterium]
MGTVQPGKLADLVLLDANPLDDIANTRKINSVVYAGRLLHKSALDAMLAQSKPSAGNCGRIESKGLRVPSGTLDNSPPFQRWVAMRQGTKSRQGRQSANTLTSALLNVVRFPGYFSERPEGVSRSE